MPIPPERVRSLLVWTSAACAAVVLTILALGSDPGTPAGPEPQPEGASIEPPPALAQHGDRTTSVERSAVDVAPILLGGGNGAIVAYAGMVVFPESWAADSTTEVSFLLPESLPDPDDEAASGLVVKRCAVALDGTFTLEIPPGLPDGVLATAFVGHQGMTVFRGCVRLGDPMILVVPAPLVLQGQVTGWREMCSSAWFVLLQEIPLGETEILAKGELEPDGRFLVLAWGAREDLRVILRVGCTDSVVAKSFALEDLRAGITWDLATRRLTLFVHDQLQRGIEGVGVAVGLLTSDLTASGNGTLLRTLSGDSGTTVIDMPAGLEVCVHVGKAGYRQRRARIAPGFGAVTLALELEPLAPEDTIDGVVVDLGGAPIAGALVSVRPLAEVAGTNLLVNTQVRTGADGTFRLAARASDPDMAFYVRAFTKAHGMSERQVVRLPARDVTIRISGLRRIRLEACTPAWNNAAVQGVIEWVLLDAQRRPVRMGSDPLPVITEPVPPGSYRLVARDPARDGYAALDLELPAEPGTTNVRLAFGGARWCEVVVGGGEGELELIAQHPEWPTLGISGWDRAARVGAGSLRVLAGDCELVPARLVDGRGETIAVLQLRAGTTQFVEVRAKR